MAMPMSERARHGLYNGLADLLGPERAETLMTHLPAYDPIQVATKLDVADLKSELKGDIGDLRNDMNAGQAAINSRLDRMYLALLAGLFVIVAAVAGVAFTAL